MTDGWPMIGTGAGRIEAVRSVDLHGDRFLDLAVRPDGMAGDAPPRVVRISEQSCGQIPAVGDHVRIELLLGQAQSLQVVAADD
ncbi:MAG: hypothetical protein AB8G96_02445 [Phycisphaerales bacterium]